MPSDRAVAHLPLDPHARVAVWAFDGAFAEVPREAALAGRAAQGAAIRLDHARRPDVDLPHGLHAHIILRRPTSSRSVTGTPRLPPISLLSLAGRPPNVTRRVIPVIVDSVYGVVLCRALAYICKKRFEPIPRRTDLDATPAVVCVVDIVRIHAAVAHVAPCLVLRFPQWSSVTLPGRVTWRHSCYSFSGPSVTYKKQIDFEHL